MELALGFWSKRILKEYYIVNGFIINDAIHELHMINILAWLNAFETVNATDNDIWSFHLSPFFSWNGSAFVAIRSVARSVATLKSVVGLNINWLLWLSR